MPQQELLPADGDELRLTENSTSTADNTSAVAWALVLRAKSYHFADYRIGWSVSLAGTAVSTRAWASVMAPERTISPTME